MNKIRLKDCPACGSDYIEIDSVVNGGSFIECVDCEYRLVASVSEQTLIKRWNKTDRALLAKATNG